MDAKNALSKTEKPNTTTLEMDDRKPVRSMVFLYHQWIHSYWIYRQ